VSQEGTGERGEEEVDEINSAMLLEVRAIFLTNSCRDYNSYFCKDLHNN
jgi:hypothetical protein